TIFVLANPDLVTLVSRRLEVVVQSLRRWLAGFSFWEVVFWVLSLWMSVGLIRPYVGRDRLTASTDDPRGPQQPIAAVPLYEAFRNTLLAVIGLFAVYLVFEFYTLWLRGFPREFFYSGRVHKYA